MKYTEKIFNIYQANYLLQNGCIAVGTGREGRNIFIKFIMDNYFNKYMESWRTRAH